MRTLAIAMDAADAELVLRWTREGKLPNLASLVERGSATRISSFTGFGPEATWPTLATGCGPGKHGIYNWRVIRPGTDERVEAPRHAFRRSFWEHMAANGQRLVLLDLRRGEPMGVANAAEIVGWGERGGTLRASSPPELITSAIAHHGRYPPGLSREHRGWLWMSALRLRTLRRMTARRTELLATLLREHDWDLCLAAYYEPHYGGHEFHRFLVPGQWGHSRRGEWLLGDALLRTYQAFDNGLGELIEGAGAETNVMVFSTYGMRPNTNGNRVLAELFDRLGYWVPARPPRRARLLERARKIALRTVPRALARSIRSRMIADDAINRHLERLWAQGTDWSRTRAYPESEAGHSYVRVSRASASQREALREELVRELEALIDEETGLPAIAEIRAREELAEGPHVGVLPDLVIKWSEHGMLRRVRHPRAGVIAEEMHELQRSEHTEEGFLICAGPAIENREDIGTGELVDLAPTFMRISGTPIPREMDGRPMDELLTDEVPPATLMDIDWTDDPWERG